MPLGLQGFRVFVVSGSSDLGLSSAYGLRLEDSRVLRFRVPLIDISLQMRQELQSESQARAEGLGFGV